jgi:phosphotransferase family enzyme
MKEDEVPLTGGNFTLVVRVGATVRRQTGPWTPAVHTLLRHLESVGFTGAPRVLGLDEQGREVLTYLAGDAGYYDNERTFPPHLWSDAVLTDAAQLLRRFHSASSSLPPVAGAAWQLVYPDATQHEVICHNDFGPYNCIFVAGKLQAIIDFDTAGPGPRVWDVAHAAYRFARLGANDLELQEQGRRLRLFCDAYGLEERTTLVETIERRVEALAAGLMEWAPTEDAAFRRHLISAAFLRRHRNILQDIVSTPSR